MKTKNDLIAIYSRKSKFTGKGESIGNQIELCRDYVRNFYGESYLSKVVVFEDEGFSGGNLNRPDFQKMMKAVRNHQFQAIIVYRLDRISRNISDFTGLIDELTKLDVSFVSIREQFDTSTPMGRAMMFIISVFSQLERETIAERIRDNMHELAKTGRWLGGITPTGFSSESVSTVTVDGRTRKACQLKVIPEEAQTVKTIFDTFSETHSLTATESELLRRRIFSKNGKPYSRYTLKCILQNPVYMAADQDSYAYFIEKEADVCFPKEAFDGNCGIMAYNRTEQEKGKHVTLLPTSEWIISVGKHPGLITSKQWIDTQQALDRNKSKAFRQPRSNEALLTGLIFCSCGSRMYPKLTTRKTASGDIIYPYMCKMKERSKREACSIRNPNGNTLDTAVIEQIKLLADSDHVFAAQLEKSRHFYTSNKEQHEKDLIDLRKEAAENEKKIAGLVDSMIMVGDSSAKTHIAKRMEELDATNKSIQSRIAELEELTSSQALSELEFDALRQMLAVFRNGVNDMTTEQKRAALRTIVRKIIWDGTNAHIILFGTSDGDIEYPDISSRLSTTQNGDRAEDGLSPFEDMEYKGDNGLGKTQPPNDSNVRWGVYRIFHTPGGISGKTGALGYIKGSDPLDQTDGADGDQILLIRCLGVILFHDVGHQAQIPGDQYVSRLQVALGGQLQIMLFLCLRQGFGKASGGQLQGVQQRTQHQPCCCQHLHHLLGKLIRHGPSFFLTNRIPGRISAGKLLSHFYSSPFSVNLGSRSALSSFPSCVTWIRIGFASAHSGSSSAFRFQHR